MRMDDIQAEAASRVAAAWFEDGLAELAGAGVLAGLSLIFAATPAIPEGWTPVAAGVWTMAALPLAGRWVQQRKLTHSVHRTGWVSFERSRPRRIAFTLVVMFGLIATVLALDTPHIAAVLAAAWAIGAGVGAWRTGLRRFQISALLGVVCAGGLLRSPLPLFTGLATVTAILAAGAAILGGGARARYLYLHREVA